MKMTLTNVISTLFVHMVHVSTHQDPIIATVLWGTKVAIVKVTSTNVITILLSVPTMEYALILWDPTSATVPWATMAIIVKMILMNVQTNLSVNMEHV